MPVGADDGRVGLGDAHATRSTRREGCGRWPAGGEVGWDRLGGEVEYLSVFDCVIPAAVRHKPASPEPVDDFERLGQHLVADVCRWPALADYVLVQALPRTQPEREPAV